MENINNTLPPCTAFDGHRRIASGVLPQVALAVRRARDSQAAGPLLIYSDTTGQLVDVDLRGTDAEIVARLAPAGPAGPSAEAIPVRGRGRPRLGVDRKSTRLNPSP